MELYETAYLLKIGEEKLQAEMRGGGFAAYNPDEECACGTDWLSTHRPTISLILGTGPQTGAKHCDRQLSMFYRPNSDGYLTPTRRCTVAPVSIRAAALIRLGARRILPLQTARGNHVFLHRD